MKLSGRNMKYETLTLYGGIICCDARDGRFNKTISIENILLSDVNAT